MTNRHGASGLGPRPSAAGVPAAVPRRPVFQGQSSHDSAGTLIRTGDFELRTRTTPGTLDRVLEHFGARRVLR
ncbi:hypothetical protein ACFZAU_36740 [Streptomyces sp. NPDC008238]